MNKVFSDNLKRLRKSKGLTQQKLSEATGIKRPTIGAYEEVRAEPNYETIKLLADFFETTTDDLFKPYTCNGAQ